MKKVVVGIDIGGTNSAIGLVDAEARCLNRAVVPTARFERPEDFVAAVCEKIEALLHSTHEPMKLSGIGIGAPNGNYYHGTIEHAPNLKWRGEGFPSSHRHNVGDRRRQRNCG